MTVKKEKKGNGGSGNNKKGNGGNGGKKGGGGGKSAEMQVTPRSEDFSQWYLDVIRDAELASYGPVRGTMVIRPYGFALWESLQTYLDRRFKETGHSNAYFPQLIPYSFITKEASHVEGFSPELALVTHGGGKELEEPLVVRPTSETIVNHMFSQWIQSYRDLPLLVNQWANVHRWEMRTRPFVRTLEFLWQEGHTAHATKEEAQEEAMKMIGVYAEFAENVAGMPVVVGRKSRVERFAGADDTYTIEAMMGDGRALQAGTSHDLGQNFARAFDTTFLAASGESAHVWQTSWGVSTRMVGGIIMTHGDDKGLRLPPRMAPIQVVVVPIYKGDDERAAVEAYARDIADRLKGAGSIFHDAPLRVELDDREALRPGFKFNHWELRGVPIRIEVGPKDLEKGACVVARRDQGKEGKQFGVMVDDSLPGIVAERLQEVQDSLLAAAREFRDGNIVDVSTYDELKEVVEAGKWARGPWAGSDEEEKQIKDETGATLRCFPFDADNSSAKSCFYSGRDDAEIAIFSKSY